MHEVNDTVMTGGEPASITALDRGTGVAAWRQIADALAAEIAGGGLRPEEQLPTEGVLSARFAVNRHTVRRALAELAGQGLVRATRGRGTFVEARPLPYPIGERTRFSENLSRAGREARGLLLTADETMADESVRAALLLPAGARVAALRTVHAADGMPISTSRTWVPLPRFAGFVEAYRATGSVTRAFAASGVADYRRFSTRVSARAVLPDEGSLLDLAPGRVVLAAESVNVDPDGTRIQLTRAAFAADRVEFVIGDETAGEETPGE